MPVYTAAPLVTPFRTVFTLRLVYAVLYALLRLPRCGYRLLPTFIPHYGLIFAYGLPRYYVYAAHAAYRLRYVLHTFTTRLHVYTPFVAGYSSRYTCGCYTHTTLPFACGSVTCCGYAYRTAAGYVGCRVVFTLPRILGLPTAHVYTYTHTFTAVLHRIHSSPFSLRSPQFWFYTTHRCWLYAPPRHPAYFTHVPVTLTVVPGLPRLLRMRCRTRTVVATIARCTAFATPLVYATRWLPFPVHALPRTHTRIPHVPVVTPPTHAHLAFFTACRFFGCVPPLPRLRCWFRFTAAVIRLSPPATLDYTRLGSSLPTFVLRVYTVVRLHLPAFAYRFFTVPFGYVWLPHCARARCWVHYYTGYLDARGSPLPHGC